MLQSIVAWMISGVFATSLVMWVRSYFAADQLERVAVRNASSSGADVVYAQHVRLSSSWGKVSLAFMLNRTPHPPTSDQKIAWSAGPAVTNWHCTHLPDDLAAVRKKAKKKWERRGVFEFGRVITKINANPNRRILPGGRERTDYLVLPWPEVCLILGLAAWPLMTGEQARRRRPWRLLRGYCVECGYNLKKSQGACPECGKGRWGLE